LSGMTSSTSDSHKIYRHAGIGKTLSGILLFRHSDECQNPDSHIEAGSAPGKSSAFY
jgi:hypothetical protein